MLGRATSDKNEETSARTDVAENLYGHTLYLQGKYAEAIPFFERSMSLGQSDGWPEHNWARALAKLGRSDEARAKYEASVQRVNASLEAAKTKLSEAAFNKLFQARKENVAVFHNALAWHIVSTGPTDELSLKRAAEVARYACDLTDNSAADFLDTLASVQAAQGDFKAAIATEERALQFVSDMSAEQTEYEMKVKEWREQAMKDQ